MRDLIKMLIYIEWLLHDLIQNIQTFKLNTAKITQYKVGRRQLDWPKKLKYIFPLAYRKILISKSLRENFVRVLCVIPEKIEINVLAISLYGNDVSI